MLYLVSIHLCFVVLHRLLFLYCIVVIHQVCTGFYTVKNKEKLETVICYSHATVSVVAMCLSIFFFFLVQAALETFVSTCHSVPAENGGSGSERASMSQCSSAVVINSAQR